MKTQIYATDLSNTHKNHLCLLIRKKLFWEHVWNGLVVQYLFVMVGREMELYHRSPLRVLNISLIKVVEQLLFGRNESKIVNGLNHIIGLCYVDWTPVFVINFCVVICDLLSNIDGSDDGRLCFSNSFHVNTCKGRTSDAQCRIGWWPALL